MLKTFWLAKANYEAMKRKYQVLVTVIEKQ